MFEIGLFKIHPCGLRRLVLVHWTLMNTGMESFLGVGQPFLIPSTWLWSCVFGALNINDLFMFWIHYFAFLCNFWSFLKMQQQFIMLHELSSSFLFHAFLVKFNLFSTTITCCWVHLGTVDLHELKYNIGSMWMMNLLCVCMYFNSACVFFYSFHDRWIQLQCKQNFIKNCHNK